MASDYCVLCGYEKENYSRYFPQPNVEMANPKTKRPNVTTEHVTIRIQVAANQGFYNHGSSEDFCEICEGRISGYLNEMEKMMWDIFQNRIWRSVDKVYETRIDCMPGQLAAAKVISVVREGVPGFQPEFYVEQCEIGDLRDVGPLF